MSAETEPQDFLISARIRQFETEAAACKGRCFRGHALRKALTECQSYEAGRTHSIMGSLIAPIPLTSQDRAGVVGHFPE